MKYKIFEYRLEGASFSDVEPDKHVEIFRRSIGKDDFGEFSPYRGQKNSVLMYLRDFSKDFSGLIGRHSQEREVTEYIESSDETASVLVSDDDYPSTPFVCFPRLRAVAVLDGSLISADAAMARLHQIIAHRTQSFFTYGTFKEAIDLRTAVERFRLLEVSFEILNFGAAVGQLGARLDESRQRDSIRRMVGKLEGTAAAPLRLNGGFMSELQELQQAARATVGYKGLDSNNTIVEVAKPKRARELSEVTDGRRGEELDFRVEFPGGRVSYPFPPAVFTQLRSVVRHLVGRAD